MAKSHERGIQVKKGESVDRALKRLKQKLDTEGIIEEMRRRRAFETPTQRKIRKHLPHDRLELQTVATEPRRHNNTI